MGSEWFRRYAPAGERPESDSDSLRLICFPHAGGAASSFLTLSRLLSPAYDVLAVQYPGRQDRRREAPFEDIGEMADALADEVLRHSGAPYAFFGHSMGALLAYETARRLGERRTPGPVRLFLSARGAPTPGQHDQQHTDAELLAIVAHLGGAGRQVLDDPELQAMILPALRADYRALGSYAWVPGFEPVIPFTVLIGDSDPVVTVAEASAWRNFTTAVTDVHIFTGGHFYLDGHTHDVAEKITAVLGGPVTPAATTLFAPHGIR
ncbi:thioesterase II family protein [Streptomyces sp. 2A115]|uniref:thioesterase II family protein n=1 Tax=Streptomyces sp. 2A115 TaxID=3457439 RepID=UPI003FD3F5FC